MINDQDDNKESQENIDNDESLIEKRSIQSGQQKTADNDSKDASSMNENNVVQGSNDFLDPIQANNDLGEIREIVETIAKAVFYIIEHNFDRLANRSSNTLGMRVKDSLIIKTQQQFNRKAIPFDDALKASDLVCRLILDDDIQLRFLPRIESIGPSSESENSSTRQKKSVSLAEEVKIFDQVDNNEACDQIEVNFLNELNDIRNEKIMEYENKEESDGETYDFTSQKGSNFTVESQEASLGQDKNSSEKNDPRKSAILDSSNDFLKFENSKKDATIFGSLLNQNQLIVNLAETTTRPSSSTLNKNLLSKEEKLVEKNLEDNKKTNTVGESHGQLESNDEDVSTVNKNEIGVKENEEITKIPEKRSSIFSRIVRSKTRREKNISSEKTGAAKNQDSAIETSCQILVDSKRSKEDESSNDQSHKKNSSNSSNIESTEFEQLGNLTSSENVKKKSSAVNEAFSKESLHGVCLEAKELSKQSKNDISLKKTLSKVFLRRVGQSSEKLSKTKLEGETSIVINKDDDNEARIHVETTDSKQSLKIGEKNSSKQILAQVFPVAEIKQRTNLVDEKIYDCDVTADKIEVKTNRSRWSLKSKKSSLILGSLDNNKTEVLENSDDENMQMVRKKSMLNVVSKSSVVEERKDYNSQLENERDNRANDNSESSLSLKKSTKGEDKSELVVNTNVDDKSVDPPLEEPLAKVKKPGGFMERLKRSRQSKKNRPKRSEGKMEAKLKVNSESQTDLENDFNSESLTESKLLNNSKKSSQSIVSKSSSRNDDDDCRKNESAGFVENANSNVEDKIKNSISDISNLKLVEETKKNIVGVYSVVVDNIPNQNHSVEDDSNANEPELVVKFSENLESSQVESGNDKPIDLQTNKSIGKLWQKISSKISNKVINTSEDSSNDSELPKRNDSMQSEEKVSKRSKKLMKTESKKKIDEKFDEFVEAEKIEKSEYKGENDEFFPQKSEPVIVSYLENSSIIERQTVIEEKAESDSVVIRRGSIEELQSQELTRQEKERHGLMSNIKSIFKSINKSESQKYSIASIENCEQNTDAIEKSMHSLNPNKFGTSGSETESEGIQNASFIEQNVPVPPILSTKSLQDNRKRSKNRKKTAGHKLFDDEAVPIKTNDSKSPIAESNSKISAADEDEEPEEEKTAELSGSWRKKKSEQKENDAGNSKKFADSLSRIFSNSSRKKNTVKESKAESNSPTKPADDHFEITRIPLSSSDDSSSQDNRCEIRNKKSDVTDDNKEEFVAIKSFDSMQDSDFRIRDHSKLLERENQTLILSVAVETNELSKPQSVKNIQEGAEKRSDKIHAVKGAVVSYAPMVESAKYISEDVNNQLNENETITDNGRERRSSSGKSFSTIRKLFSKASEPRSKSDDAASSEDHSVDQTGSEIKQDSLKLKKFRKNKNRLNSETEDGSSISEKMVDEVNNVDDEEEINKRSSMFKFKDRKSRELIVNRSESVDEKIKTIGIEDFENRSDVVVNKIEIDQLSLIPTELEKQVDEEPAIRSENQTDFGSTTNDLENKIDKKSSHNKKGSFLAMAKSYMRKHSDVEKEEKDEVKELSAGNKKSSETLATLTDNDSKISSKEQGVPKSESVFSSRFKRLFKKRSSIASTKNIEDSANELRQLNRDTANLRDESGGVMIETAEADFEEEKRENAEIKSGDIEFAVYKSTVSKPKSNNYLNYEERNKSPVDTNSQKASEQQSKKLKSKKEDKRIKSSKASTNSKTNTETSYSSLGTNVEPESSKIQNVSHSPKRSKSKTGSENFGLNRSFASKRSTIVMVAAADQSRKEPQSEESGSGSSNHQQNESSSSPTAFYYLLGPSLDEALVDVRVVFQNLIDKIIGKSR